MAQKREPLFFFLARAASPPSLSATVPTTPPRELRLFFHHRCVATVASCLRPRYSGQSSLRLDSVSLFATVSATLHHHASPSSSSTNVVLPPNCLASSHVAPATVTAPLFPAPPFRARTFSFFPAIVALRFLQGKFPTRFCLVFRFVYVNFQF